MIQHWNSTKTEQMTKNGCTFFVSAFIESVCYLTNFVSQFLVKFQKATKKHNIQYEYFYKSIETFALSASLRITLADLS